MSGLPQERINARPRKATFLVKPGLVFVANSKLQCIGSTGRIWSRWPTTLHKPQQSVNARGRNLMPTLTRKAAMTTPEQRGRFAQVLLHLGFGHICDRDIPMCEMVNEAARIGAIVPDHHRAVPLFGQYGFEFSDYFAIGFYHRWLLRWSNDSRCSPENNAEQSRRLPAGFHGPVHCSSAL